MRPRTQKIPRTLQVPLTNAEKCKAYRERLAKDKLRNARAKQKQKEASRRYCATLTPAQKARARETARIRQQRRRQRLKQMESSNMPASKPKSKSKSKSKPKASRILKTSEEAKIDAHRREQNRQSQQKRRANMTPQKKSLEREKRRLYYREQKARVKSEETYEFEIEYL